MIEKDTIAGKKVVALSVIDRHPEGMHFSYGIRAPGMERGVLILGWWCIAEHLAAGCLVEFGFYAAPPYSFQDSGSAQGGDIAGILRHVKANPHLALGSQMVNFIRIDIIEQVG